MARLGRSQPFAPLLQRFRAAAAGNQSLAASAAVATWVVASVVVASPVTIDATTAVASAAWTVPATTAPLSIVTPSAVASWAVPSATVVPGAVSIPATEGIATWVVPTASLGANQNLNADTPTAVWTVPASAAPRTAIADSAVASWTVPASVAPLSIVVGSAFASWLLPAVGVNGAALVFILDLNTRLRVYLDSLTGRDPGDLTTEYTKQADTLTGDANSRMARIIDDATP